MLTRVLGLSSDSKVPGLSSSISSRNATWYFGARRSGAARRVWHARGTDLHIAQCTGPSPRTQSGWWRAGQVNATDTL